MAHSGEAQHDDRASGRALIPDWQRRSPACVERRIMHGQERVRDHGAGLAKPAHHYRAGDDPGRLTLIISSMLAMSLWLVACMALDPAPPGVVALCWAVAPMIWPFLLPRLNPPMVALQRSRPTPGFEHGGPAR